LSLAQWRGASYGGGMVEAQVWTLIGLLATALFTVLFQLRSLEQRLSDRFAGAASDLQGLSTEMQRGFGEIRGDIAVIKAQINRDGR
jgi:hypothetical protein